MTNVVLVTGGSGFVGQHIINLLQTKVDQITEIRVLDMQPYRNKLGHVERHKIQSTVGSITDWETVLQACEGVDCVMHVAGLVDPRMFPDVKKLETVNVHGTRNVVEACIQQKVKRLIFCSTVDVVMGHQDIVNGTEDATSKPDHFLFGAYAATKQRAEEMVLKADLTPLRGDSGHLRTVSIRPVTMYGEEDKHVITSSLEIASKMGTIQRITTGKAVQQNAYVGNVAWMFVCADNTLKNKPSSVGGQAFFATDDTALSSLIDFMEPYVVANGFRYSSFAIPSSLVIGLVYIATFLLWVISPVTEINPGVGISSLLYMTRTYYFSYNKAKTFLSYEPLYSPTEARARAMKFYRNFSTNKMCSQ